MPNMHDLSIFTYLLDGAGNYTYDENGNYLLGQTTNYQYNRDYARVASSSMMRGKPGIKSFSIQQSNVDGRMALTVNIKQFIGLYPNLEAALGVVFGLYIHNNGRAETFQEWVQTLFLGDKVQFPVPSSVIDFDVAVSGTNGLPATDVELGDIAYAVITDSSTGGTPTFSYEWYQSVPTLTGITLSNEGP